MLKTVKLGFIGAGQMAKAIGFPLLEKGLVKPSQIIASSPDDAYLESWQELGCRTTKENGEVADTSSTIIWAVKPQVFPAAVKETVIKESARRFHISIMAGVTLKDFSDTLKAQFREEKLPVARAMPNIGMKVGAGCSVYTVGRDSSIGEKTILSEILSANGLSYEVPEAQINAYCGLFASGIGFMFVILEAMSDGAVSVGIPRDLSLKIAAQTMKGAAEIMLSNADVHPATLKDSVCSPGGTTIAGVAEMEKYGVRNGVISAIVAATKRGDELGKIK